MKEGFGYLRASSILDAVTLLTEPGVRSSPLAGGTDLVLLIHEHSTIIDISFISELHTILLESEFAIPWLTWNVFFLVTIYAKKAMIGHASWV